MRNPLRLAFLAGAVLAGVTCTDAPTAPLAPRPAGSPGRLSLAPSFSREAAAAWQSLAAFNLAPNNVHVVLKRPGPPEVILLDTVVTIAPGQTEISLELTVPINGPEEQLGASIQVRDGTQVLFEGTTRVTAVRAGTPGAPPGGGSNGVTVDYVGPGAAARAIRISPRDQVVATGASIAFGVTATDASGAAMTPPPVAWSLSDATLGTIGAGDGAFTAGTKRGTVIVRATTPSAIRDSVTIGIVPPAQRIVTIAGAGQDASAGKAVAQPFVVEVQAADGLPVPGVAVAFTASAGASVAPASATTDAAGRASATMTVGRTPGSYTFTATAGTLGSTSVTARATPAPASVIAVVSGSGQVGAVGTPAAQPLVVRVSNEFGTPVAGASVAWAIASGGGTLSSATVVTDADGLAQVSYSYGTAPGAASVTATVTTPAGSSSATFALTAAPASVAALAIVSGSGQVGAPNEALLPFVVKATDAQGNPAPGFTISWTTDAGTLSSTTSTTGADGTASVVLTLGATAGQVQVTATAPATATTPAAAVIFVATTTSGSASRIEVLAGDGQSAPVGTPVAIAPAVKVLDAFGNRVPGVPVTFAVTSGGGSVTGASVTTDANGVATVGSWTLGTTPGANSLAATSGTLGTTFSATATGASGPPARLVALNGSTFSYTAGVTVTAWPQVKVVDTAGIAVPGVPVSVSVTDPSGSVTSFTVTTDAGGVAELHPATVTSFGGAGTYSGVASIAAASASPVSFTITVTPGPLAGLVITTQPARSASVGVALSPQPVVRAVDANGNAIAGVPVTVSIASGGGAFATSSVTTVTTDANGVAAFSGLAFASGSGTQSLTFTSGSIASAIADVTIFANAPVVTGLAVSPTLMVTGATGSWSATIANGTASAISGVVLQGWIEQGGTRAASGGMTPTCGAAPAGTLDAGASCGVTFSFTVPGSGLVTGSATFVLEMMSGTTVVATAQVPMTISTTAPPAGTTNSWTGAVSSDWHTAGNWSANRVPTTTDTIWIPQQAPLGLTTAGAMNYGGITLSANAVVGAIHAVPYSIGIDVQDFELHVTGRALDMGGSSITSSTGLGSVKLSGTNPLLNVYDLPAMSVYGGAQVAAGTEPWVNGNLSIFGGTFALQPDNYLDVDGTLRIEGPSAALKMTGNSSTESSSSVYVYGSYIASGAASDTTLLDGYLHVEGDLRQSGDAKSFAPAPGVYVSMTPSGAARVSFTDFTNSKFQDLDLYSPYTPPPALRAAGDAATPVPARVTLRREAMVRSEARASTRLRERRAARATRTPAGMAALTVSPGINFETSANIASYLYVDAPLAILNSGSTVNAAYMYVSDHAAFEIASGAAMHVASDCGFSSGAPTIPTGICPNPQYVAASMQPTAPGSDVFAVANGALFAGPTGWGVSVLDSRSIAMADTPVSFALAANENSACTFGTSTVDIVSSTSVNTDASGIAAMPLRLTGNSGSCLIQAQSGYVTYLLRVYAVPGPSNNYKVFIGANGGSWADPLNWFDMATQTQVAPAAGDRVFISYAAVTRNAPVLTGPTSAGVVRFTSGGQLALGGHTLTVSDSLTGGMIVGDAGSVVQLTGTNQLVGTSVSGARLVFGSSGCSTQSFRLAASISGDGGVDVNCPLDLNGNTLVSGGALTTAGMGAFTMDASGGIVVQGDATFNGAAGNITGGTIQLQGNLLVGGLSSLQLADAAAVNMISTSASARTITFPASANSNRLGSLYVSNAGGVQFSGQGTIGQMLYLYGGDTRTNASKFSIASGASLTAGQSVEVGPFALLTVDGSLTATTLSIGTSGEVVVNGTGVLSVQNCPQSSQVSGSGSRGSCAPPQ